MVRMMRLLVATTVAMPTKDDYFSDVCSVINRAHAAHHAPFPRQRLPGERGHGADRPLSRAKPANLLHSQSLGHVPGERGNSSDRLPCRAKTGQEAPAQDCVGRANTDTARTALSTGRSLPTMLHSPDHPPLLGERGDGAERLPCRAKTSPPGEDLPVGRGPPCRAQTISFAFPPALWAMNEEWPRP